MAAHLYSVDGGPPEAIPWLEAGEMALNWSPDGHSVFLRERPYEAARIARLDLRTGRREPWKELMPADPAGVHNLYRCK